MVDIMDPKELIRRLRSQYIDGQDLVTWKIEHWEAVRQAAIYIERNEKFISTVQDFIKAEDPVKMSATPRSYYFTDIKIAEWAHRNGIDGSLSSIRCAFEDARTM